MLSFALCGDALSALQLTRRDGFVCTSRCAQRAAPRAQRSVILHYFSTEAVHSHCESATALGAARGVVVG